MPTLFHHEIESYRGELKRLKSDIQERPNAVENLTHAAFGLSNRGHQMVVGLCGLVEVHLFRLAESGKSPIRLSDVKGQGISKLKLYLSRLKIVDFGKLKRWDEFTSVCELRNSIVHSYGGMIVAEPSEKLLHHLAKLGLKHVLVGGRRLRLEPDALEMILGIVDSLLAELGAYDDTKPNQPAQDNPGSRPSSDDSPALESPSASAPRG